MTTLATDWRFLGTRKFGQARTSSCRSLCVIASCTLFHLSTSVYMHTSTHFGLVRGQLDWGLIMSSMIPVKLTPTGKCVVDDLHLENRKPYHTSQKCLRIRGRLHKFPTVICTRLCTPCLDSARSSQREGFDYNEFAMTVLAIDVCCTA